MKEIEVFVSTTTFAEFDKEPLMLLEEKDVSYTINPFKRKLTAEGCSAVLKENSYAKEARVKMEIEAVKNLSKGIGRG